MSPFSTQVMRSNPRQVLLFLLIPLLGIGILLALHFNDSPQGSFQKYRTALLDKNWVKAAALSDKNTRDHLSSLDQWVWTGRPEDIEGLNAFQQFLIFTTRCRILGEGRPRPTESEMFGIWLDALQINRLLIQSKIINLYSYGGKYIGQLYLNQAKLASGKQIRFTREGKWKLEIMTLMRNSYDAASAEGNRQLLRRVNQDYFSKGFSNQHLMPLRFQLEPEGIP